MNTKRITNSKRLSILITICIAWLLSTTGVLANTQTGDGGDLPAYARIERGEILHTDEWAPIVFYRPPECIPAEFNLLDFMDFNAFACTPYTTDGIIVWSGEPWISFPILINLHQIDLVPVWFVSWEELQGAVADDVLTISELAGLSSLMRGSADKYSETLHPTGDVVVPMINYVAIGKLEDGRDFIVHALLVVDRNTNVDISFK